MSETKKKSRSRSKSKSKPDGASTEEKSPKDESPKDKSAQGDKTAKDESTQAETCEDTSSRAPAEVDDSTAPESPGVAAGDEDDGSAHAKQRAERSPYGFPGLSPIAIHWEKVKPPVESLETDRDEFDDPVEPKDALGFHVGVQYLTYFSGSPPPGARHKKIADETRPSRLIWVSEADIIGPTEPMLVKGLAKLQQFLDADPKLRKRFLDAVQAKPPEPPLGQAVHFKNRSLPFSLCHEDKTSIFEGELRLELRSRIKESSSPLGPQAYEVTAQLRLVVDHLEAPNEKPKKNHCLAKLNFSTTVTLQKESASDSSADSD